MSIIIFLIILAVLILAHELGHFIVAKRAGIKVDEFGIGFPPRLFGIKKGETLYSLNAIPFGGFVKIFGEDYDEESMTGPERERSFIGKPRLSQAAVLGAGVVFNILLAWILLSAALTAGLPAPVGAFPSRIAGERHTVVTSVLAGSPAEAAGIKPGDIILSLRAGEKIARGAEAETVSNFISEYGEKEIQILLKRDGEQAEAIASPSREIVPERYAIGIAMDEIAIARLPFYAAAAEGAKMTYKIIGETAVAFARLVFGIFKGSADFSEITGPVGIIDLIGGAASFGASYLLGFTSFISVNLAVINLIPFPALDGGRLAMVLIEAVRGKPFGPRLVKVLNAAGFAALIALMIAVTYNDIVRLLP